MDIYIHTFSRKYEISIISHDRIEIKNAFQSSVNLKRHYGRNQLDLLLLELYLHDGDAK